MIDPNKMDAFVNKNTAPPPNVTESEGDDEQAGEEAEEGNSDKMLKLIPLIEEYLEDVIDCTDEVDPDALDDTNSELSEDDAQIIRDGVANLDRRLQKEINSVAAQGISNEDAMYVAEHLESEAMIDDVQRFAGWLFRVGEVLGGGGEPEQENGENEDQEEQEEIGEPE